MDADRHYRARDCDSWRLRRAATGRPGIPAFAEYELIENVSAPDPSTITVIWKRPYIDADGLFGYRSAGLPMAKHQLEQAFNEDKANFTGLSSWNTDFLGAGLYRVRDW